MQNIVTQKFDESDDLDTPEIPKSVSLYNMVICPFSPSRTFECISFEDEPSSFLKSLQKKLNEQDTLNSSFDNDPVRTQSNSVNYNIGDLASQVDVLTNIVSRYQKDFNLLAEEILILNKQISKVKQDLNFSNT